VAKVGRYNQDRTISLKVTVRSYINKQMNVFVYTYIYIIGRENTIFEC